MEKRIQSIQRAIDIINCFNEEDTELSLSQISERLSLHINTTRGIVQTLVANNLISHNKKTNVYSLGLFFIMKSNLLLATEHMNRWIQSAIPFLQKITDEYGAFTSLQRIFDNNIVMVKTIQPVKAQFIIVPQEYSSMNYHCTSSGKLFLQYLSEQEREETLGLMEFSMFTPETTPNEKELKEQIKRQKETIFSSSFDEELIGISTMSAPILVGKKDKKLYGTITLAGPTQIVRKNYRKIGESLLSAAKEIEKKVL